MRTSGTAATDADYGRSQHYNDSRYHMLNLHATFTKGTVEFRLFQFDEPTDRAPGRHPRRTAQELHSALPRPEPDGKDGAEPQAPSPSRTRTPNTPCAPGSSASASSARSSQRQEIS
ncbi:MAG: amidoligase family protein [Coprococcus sp.]